MFDFCINGAGMVGAATALGLARAGYSVALIEQRPPQPYCAEQSPDLRMSAISMASVNLLDELGAWSHIEAMRVRPYHGLSVWEHPDCRTDFVAQEVGYDLLGYFVENRVIQLGCHAALKSYDNVTWFSPARIEHIERNDTQPVQITLDDNSTLTCQWLIGADGAESQVRQAAGIGISGWQYQQQAMGITVQFDEPVDGITWQQFTPQGPRALLPMHENFASLIWYDMPDVLKDLKRQSNAQIKESIVAHFPPLPGDFDVLNCAAFTLIRRHASQYVLPGVILVGDAAHTINPLAGQGVNLGFKDIKALLAVLSDKPDLASTTCLKMLQEDYELPRQRDNALMMSAMDGFYSTFSNDIGPLKLLRNGLLKLAHHSGPIKQQVLKYAMGLSE
ncbi:FAD-dependent oxidoreductase [Marisediminitalea sp.]|uniref:FAD-dependent oxidoreductase n=1 Tax=Marisediminitalea sp. TaxID=2662268 RepID=UPI003511C3FA